MMKWVKNKMKQDLKEVDEAILTQKKAIQELERLNKELKKLK